MGPVSAKATSHRVAQHVVGDPSLQMINHYVSRHSENEAAVQIILQEGQKGISSSHKNFIQHINVREREISSILNRPALYVQPQIPRVLFFRRKRLQIQKDPKPIHPRAACPGDTVSRRSK
ncbi:hypothetical protein TNCV_4883641 [Trichonephila clavipes]|nr:hypothetical protein TNCV_4883641 [Trichonephila clavipes]